MEAKAPNTCVVCKETSDQVALHYTRLLCNGCRAFFKRTVQGKFKLPACKADGKCVIDPSTRKVCKACRFDACKRAGVDSAKVQKQKEETASQQQAHATNIDNNQLLPPALYAPRPLYPPFYLPTQDSQLSKNMSAVPPVTNFQTPSVGIDLFNQIMGATLGGQQVVTSRSLLDSQFPFHYGSSAASTSSMPQWSSKPGGSLLSSRLSSLEPNKMLASTSHSLPFGSSTNGVTSSKYMPYLDLAKYTSSMGSSSFYGPSSSSAAHYGAMANTNAFSPADLSLANLSSYLSSRSLASSCVDRHRLNSLDLNRPPALLTDSARASHASSLRPDMTSQGFSSVLFPTGIPSMDIKRDTVDGSRQAVRTNQAACVDIKEEQDEDNSCSECHSCTDSQEEGDGVFRYTLPQGSNSYPVSSVQSSGKSNGFMIDMLLKSSGQRSVEPRGDNGTPIQSPQGESDQDNLSASGSRNQQDKNPAEDQEEIQTPTNSYLGENSLTCSNKINHDDLQIPVYEKVSRQAEGMVYENKASSVAKSCTRSESDEKAQQELNNTSVSGQPMCEPSANDTLEDVELYTADGDTLLQELTSKHVTPTEKHVTPTEAFCHLSTNSAVSANASKEAYEKSTKSNGNTDDDDIATTTKRLHIHSSLELNQTQTTSSGDSGLSRSSGLSACGPNAVRPRSVDNKAATASEPADVQNVNIENKQGPKPMKRRLSQSEESCIRSRKKNRPGNHSFASFRNCLKDISQNNGMEIDNIENNERKMPVSSATSSNSSEDEAESRNMFPQFTSTPVKDTITDKSQFFLKIACAFAKYCQYEQKNSPDKNCFSAELSPSRLSTSKESSPSASENDNSFDQLLSSDNHSRKVEKFEELQEMLMRKVRSLDTYTMAEFKADVMKLRALAKATGR